MKDTSFLARTIWNYHRIKDKITKADCIIGLGSYDLRVADRCVDLLKQGFGSVILFSGAEGNWTRGRWNKTESEIFKDRAIELGLNESQILIESQSTNLGENLRFCKKLIHFQRLDFQNAIIVTKPQTERRVFATLPIEWPEIDAMVTSPMVDLENQPTKFHTMEDLINEMVGDLQRIILYGEKGLQAKQDIPDIVLNAYYDLIEKGYIKHMIIN